MTGAPETALDVAALHAAVVAKLAARFPDLHVEAYREDRTSLPLPALLVDLVDFEAAPEADPGTEQLAMVARFEARVILGFRTPQAEIGVRSLAAALGAFIHLHRFGQPVGPGEVTLIAADEFAPELDRYVVWSVEWRHLVHLGTSVWTNDGTIPADVLYSWTPRVGPGNEPWYREAEE